MPTHLAFIRAINVGGKNILPMADLRAIFTSLGCSDVSTYIQSGNVLFNAPARLAASLPAKAPKAIEKQFGFAPAVMVRAKEELPAEHPFYTPGIEDKLLFVAFLNDPAKPITIDPAKLGSDRLEVRNRELFIHYTSGPIKTKLTAPYLDKLLGQPSTFRNWRTVTTLAAQLNSKT